MTHDELLKRLSPATNYEPIYAIGERQLLNAVKALVELHKPEIGNADKSNSDFQGYCSACTPLSINYYEAILYPCPTIQAIEWGLE